MTRIRLLLATVVLSASTLAAQGGQGGPPPGGMGGGRGGMMGGQGGMMGRQNEMLFKGITLTAAQQAKVDSIQAKGREEMMAMMQGGGQDRAALREVMMQTRAKQMADIRGVLTAEQQAAFDRNVAEMPQGPGGGRRPPR
jgi:Spy/CpxP family protein refolding chaperone